MGVPRPQEVLIVPRRHIAAIFLVLLVPILGDCTVKRETVPGNAGVLDDRSPYIKAHMNNGNVYVLSEWTVDEDGKTVSGVGTLYDTNRIKMGDGTFTVGVDSVAVFESNVKQPSGAIAAITILAGITVAVTIACISNPKACFGSCPTFYILEGDQQELRAEGFSSSVAPWLEASDVDALRRRAVGGERVDIVMRNEALETHVVRHADLIAVPVGDKGRVLKDTGDEFWRVGDPIPPAAGRAEEGDVFQLVRALDGVERFSPADSTDLGARETIDVRFGEVPAGAYGLVIAARQTLMSTYLLYETLANAGSEVGAWLAELSRYQPDNPLAHALGGIHVETRDADGGWRVVGEAGEVGPLATDVFLVPLPAWADDAAVDVRLRLTKGAWRVDQIALARLEGKAEGIRLHPAAVLRDGRADDEALALLWNPASSLTTMPGDDYTLRYELPDDGREYELFLESRGYYLEWMREEWLADENQDRAREMLFTPRLALRRLAPQYKEVEQSIEEAFWSSRYAKP